MIYENHDENLGEYWSIISQEERKNMFAKEVHLRYWYGIKVLDDDQLEKLRTANNGPKNFNSTSCSYDILTDLNIQN